MHPLARPPVARPHAASLLVSFLLPALPPSHPPVRSRCQREMGSFWARCAMVALAMPRFPSLFSKSMGLT